VDGGSAANKGSGESITQEPPPVKKYNKPAAAAQAPAVENQELFMALLRDSLRTVAEHPSYSAFGLRHGGLFPKTLCLGKGCARPYLR